MKRHIGIGLNLIAAAALVSACADDNSSPNTRTASGAPTSQQCFHPNDVVSFHQISIIKFSVRTIRGDVFSADLPVCRGIDFAQRIALQPDHNTQICDGDIGTLVTQDPGGETLTCPAYNFHHLTAAEVSALQNMPRS